MLTRTCDPRLPAPTPGFPPPPPPTHFSKSTKPKTCKSYVEIRNAEQNLLPEATVNQQIWAVTPADTYLPLWPTEETGKKIMKWWHANKFYTGNKEPSFQILIARANAIAFGAMLVSLWSYTVGGRERRRGRGSRSRRGRADAVSRPAPAQRLCPMGRQSAAFSRPGPAASLPWVGFLIGGGRKRCGWKETGLTPI